MAKTPAWQRAAGKNPEGGLSEKGRASLRAAGHDIKRPQPEGGARKDSFCARMKGMKAKLTSSETANDPDSRINKSLRKWKCADGGAVDPYDSVQQAAKGGPIWDKPRPKKLGKPEPLSSKEKASAKASAKAAGRPYPNLVDNMRAARADGGELIDPYDAVQNAANTDGKSPYGGDLEQNQKMSGASSAPNDYLYLAKPSSQPIENAKQLEIGNLQRQIFPSFAENVISKSHEQAAAIADKSPNIVASDQMITPQLMESELSKSGRREPLDVNQNIATSSAYGTSTVTDPEGRTGHPVFVAGTTPTGQNVPLNSGQQAVMAAHLARIYKNYNPSGDYNAITNYFPKTQSELTPEGKSAITIGINTGYKERPESFPHELGHAVADYQTRFDNPLEGASPEALAQFRNMVRLRQDVDYKNRPDLKEYVNRPQEQWAEGFRGYITDPKMFKQTYPDAARFMRGIINTDPRINKLLNLSRNNEIQGIQSAANGGQVDDRAHEFVQEQLKSGEPQVPQYVAENDFPARAARGVEAIDTAASKINNLLANVAGQPAMRSPEGRTASEVVQSSMPVDPYQAVQQAASQWREGDKLGAAETMAAGMPMQGAIRAYHGSPHKFDKFDISKIGTGEGAQAYGHGLYFAGNEGVARSYRNALSDTVDAPKSIDPLHKRIAQMALTFGDNTPEGALRWLDKYKNGAGHTVPAMTPEAVSSVRRGFEHGELIPGGHMYEVDIHADPSHMLDWDKPLSEQPAVMERLVGGAKHPEDWVPDPTVKGSKYWAETQGGPPDRRIFMQSRNIPGIKYLDQGSRAAGEGSRNYVIFDPSLIDIKRRYADGGEVEGDVQFAPDDPYAKVQEAANLPMMARNDFAMRMPEPEVRYDTGPQPGEAELRSYDPTIKERIYQGIAGTEERPSPERAQFARGMSQMAEFAPVLGNVMAGQEAQRRGDTKGMLMAALPVPGMATEARMAEAAISPAQEAAKEAYQRVLNAQGLYSHAAEAAANLPQAKGSYEQMMAMLQKAGVKPEEMRWSGVEQFAGQPVTREQLVSHFEQNVPKIEETVLGSYQNPYSHRSADEWQAAINRAERSGNFDEAERLTNAWEHFEGYGAAGASGSAKFQQYTLPGGENYREVLLNLPNKRLTEEEARRVLGAPEGTRMGSGDIAYASRKASPEFQSSHWDQPNVLGHLRMSDRTGPEGEKILHLEELQSDWGQAARKHGTTATDKSELERIKNEVNEIKSAMAKAVSGSDEEEALTNRLYDLRSQYRDLERRPSVPSAPYVESTKNWVDLGLKRALKEAAEGGYGKMVWTPGEEQAARYDLSKHIDELHWHRGNLVAYDKDGNKVIQRTGMSASELPDLVGKDVADKLLAQEAGSDGWRSLEGQDLKVGGEGMKSFYDKMVPTRLKELLKKIDPQAKMSMTEINGEDGPIKVPTVEITPKIREAVKKGLPLYAKGGEVVNNADPYDNIQLAAKISPRARRASK